MRSQLASLAVALGLLLAAPAGAQTPLACTPQALGQRVCQAEGVCECTYFAGGLMFRDPPGYRWDCSLTRGTCLGNEPMPLLSRLTVPGPVPSPAFTSSRTVTRTVTTNAAAQPAVRFVQADLKRHGFDPGAVDGIVGPRTRTALAAYQRANHLAVTGTLTQETIRSLRR